MEPKPKRTKTPEQALTHLMQLCARAEKSSGDARRLMRTWGVETAAQEAVLQRLIADRFIDDSRYAAAFVREKSRIDGWGAHKIRTALQRKQIDRQTIGEALAQIDPADASERLRTLLARKLRGTKADTAFKLRGKLLRYGLSAGYDYALVAEAVEGLIPDNDNDEKCTEF